MASKRVCPTGWAVVILSSINLNLIEELYGNVELNPQSQFYLDAELGITPFPFPLSLFVSLCKGLPFPRLK
jgi:hypothetical protein